MGEIVYFAEEKTERTQDARDWNALDMLESLVRDIKAGRVKPEQICVHYWVRDEEGNRAHFFSVAGMTFPEHLALLTVAAHETIQAWQGQGD